MITFVRWIVGLFFIVCVSLYVLILALPVFFNPNDYKDQLIELVKEKTGKQLEIAGDIQIQTSPWLNATCTLNKARLAGNSLFTNSTCIASEQTKIELSILPLLLQKRLHMASIVLDGVTLNLLQNKEGLNNWQRISKLSGEKGAAADQGTEPAPPETQITPATPPLTRFLLGVNGLDLGKLHLTRVNLRYDNRQTDTIIFLKDVQIKTGRLRENIPFPVEADFNLTLDNHGKKTSLPRSGDITMQGNATLFWHERRLLLEDLRMDATLKGKSLPKRGMKIGLTTNSDIHLREQKVTIKDFSLSQDNAVLQGSGTVENFTNPEVTLALKIPECSPQPILKQIKTTLPLVQNKDAFTLLSGNMLVKGNRDLIEFTDLTMMLDATTVTGAMTIKDLKNPAYEAAIHLNQLDLDRYSGKSATNSPGIPVQLLDDLLLQLDLQLDSVKVGGAALSQVQIKLNSKDGVIQLAPLTANWYDGTIKLEARVDVTGDVPQIQLKPRINKVKLKQLYQDMTGQEDVAGTAFLNADLTTSGLAQDDLLQHMNGTLRLEILNGNLKAFPVRQQIETTLAATKTPPNEPPAKTTLDDKGTEFSQLTGTALIKEGLLSNDDLTLTSETMQIHGGGTIDLTGQQVDFILSVTLPLETPLDKNREAGESNALTVVPYKISGPYSALTQAADVTQFLPPEAAMPPPEEVPAAADIKDKEPVPEKNEAAIFPE
ncbi:MAG: AsmA family protein [Desulfobulbaceae bacterium]|nr:AsmA family protein [Desulfobulbaceae bacterium]